MSAPAGKHEAPTSGATTIPVVWVVYPFRNSGGVERVQ
jgi:hypothetical protein